MFHSLISGSSTIGRGLIYCSVCDFELSPVSFLSWYSIELFSFSLYWCYLLRSYKSLFMTLYFIHFVLMLSLFLKKTAFPLHPSHNSQISEIEFRNRKWKYDNYRPIAVSFSNCTWWESGRWEKQNLMTNQFRICISFKMYIHFINSIFVKELYDLIVVLGTKN